VKYQASCLKVVQHWSCQIIRLNNVLVSLSGCSGITLSLICLRSVAYGMSSRIRIGAQFVRASSRPSGIGAGSSRGGAGTVGNNGLGSTRSGAGAARGSSHSSRRLGSLCRAGLRAAHGGPRCASRRLPRAGCPAMLDLFLHAWDELDDI
jgi:hypothetical protein